MSIFEVDKKGLGRLFKGKDKSFIIRELVQNAWDEPGVTECNIEFRWDNRKATLMVQDDAPEGFYDLRHAYTLFASTRKQDNPEKRGRFNLGEKLVIALCKEARITTTKGTVIFNSERHHSRKKTEKGSIFEGVISISRKEFDEISQTIRLIISPENILTTFNGTVIPARKPIAEIHTRLQTEYADENGNMKYTVRKTVVEVHKVKEGEVGTIYEMGLTVVETGDKWHYNVMQRVPLNMDRDNVKPAFLKAVRAAVLNETHSELQGEDASSNWVREATRHKDVSPEAIKTVADKRWGNKRVVIDPTDPQSRERAISHGYAVVGSRSMDKDEWENFRKADAVPSSSALFPTILKDAFDIHKNNWTDDQKRMARFIRLISSKCLGITIRVKIIESEAGTLADYKSGGIRLNSTNLGARWWAKPLSKEVISLVLHELAHEFGDHLQASYYNGIADLGAKLSLLMLEQPELFEEYR